MMCQKLWGRGGGQLFPCSASFRRPCHNSEQQAGCDSNTFDASYSRVYDDIALIHKNDTVAIQGLNEILYDLWVLWLISFLVLFEVGICLTCKYRKWSITFWGHYNKDVSTYIIQNLTYYYARRIYWNFIE